MIHETIDEPQPLTIEQVEAMLLEQFPPEPPVEPFAGDPTATWTYWTEFDTAERGVPTDWVWERLRAKRNALMSESDWRVVADASWDVSPWVAYRKALRDLPGKTKDPRKAVWPKEPSA